jgi:hypothetical protein
VRRGQLVERKNDVGKDADPLSRQRRQSDLSLVLDLRGLAF